MMLWTAALRQLRGSGSLALRIEVPAQPLPAFDVVVLPHLELSCVFRQALRKARLEHEGHRVGELHRLVLAVSCVLEPGFVPALRPPAIVRRHAPPPPALP